MNAESYCREQMDQGRRCGLRWGHQGAHRCCAVHDKKPAQGWQDTRENY